MYWPGEADHDLLDPTTRSAFVDRMHELELGVHPWTMRDDNLYYMDTSIEETMLYIHKGVDGLFTEFPHSTLQLFNEHGTEANFPPQQEIY
eukprot:CAMPEP_0176394332 /NCGR_PEP_ID=MMETSP0126-20121128/42481_1 /TAXON_ID=141414 ORGANISM="Strombidinopsis acuminatum, Strain SPMC142" /NCGR_SAMPLE_ID=MMETSP0126 /ASSEMBLY_ACC=CAM_ASM_000229 /LENGTH=90 /DNA_ID=CAMNT_0017766461 /DNA_START=802 /DNA_END=1074 /DNA_ORIENTATION=-